ncbi:MAG: peptide-methionine (R)-S-oxide reductase MsrB [Succinivibrio sp.]
MASKEALKALDPKRYALEGRDKEEAVGRLSKLEYRVTQEGQDEAPFSGEYLDTATAGVYVDRVTGAPLFLSSDKFNSGCGWPSFTKPIDRSVISKIPDNRGGRRLIEVVSKAGGTRLGHVFGDGPRESGGLRYCINSAALRFVPYDCLDKEGLGALKEFFGGKHDGQGEH